MLDRLDIFFDLLTFAYCLMLFLEQEHGLRLMFANLASSSGPLAAALAREEQALVMLVLQEQGRQNTTTKAIATTAQIVTTTPAPEEQGSFEDFINQYGLANVIAVLIASVVVLGGVGTVGFKAARKRRLLNAQTTTIRSVLRGEPECHMIRAKTGTVPELEIPLDKFYKSASKMC